MRTIAVTGGIGSGKSMVCSFLADRGIPVYDSDSRTKALYDTSSALARSIQMQMERFGGAKVVGEDGKIDRKALAGVVFSNPGALAVLEAVVHPAVLEDFCRWREGFEGAEAVVIESAIILEKPLFQGVVDVVLVVAAPQELRLERAMARDGADEAAVRRRMESQSLFDDISGEGWVAENMYVIVNDSTPGQLGVKTDKFVEEILYWYENRSH